jgi:hypothetical protein
MRKSILTLLILQTSFFAFSQKQDENIVLNHNSLGEQKSKKIGITFQVSNPNNDDINIGWFNIDTESIDNYTLSRKSYSYGLLLNYSVRDETAIRFRFGITKYNIIEKSSWYLISTSGEQTKFHFAPGLIWKINSRKFTLFGGFEFPINLHGEYKLTQHFINNNIITSVPKGYSFGIGGVMGFDFFPTKILSLGAEFSPSLLNTNLSGKTKTVNSPTNNFYTHDEDKSFILYQQRVSINLSIWF